jgi:serine/threonine-protein kinase
MASLPLVGEEFAGYRLVSVLGKGGMSIVFRAENPRLGNVIALKVLDPSLATDDIFRTRFLEESRIAASMNHPNVIPIHDMGSSNGLLYIAMRCVTGTDLRQMIKKRGRLAPETSVFLLSQVARALDAAHRRGLVHRDVKPGNLLVERGNDDSDPDHVYLADFGITKHVDGRTGLTSTGAFLGTIDYVAPEQIRGLAVLGLADQYSLGCVLYECLTGRVPFEKDLDAAIIWAHVQDAPTLPTALRPDLPPAVDEVFARVLAKDPGDRFPSCRDLMTAARDALGPMAEPHSAGSALRGVLPGGGGPPPAQLPGTTLPRGGRAPHLLRRHRPEPAAHSAEVAHEQGGHSRGVRPAADRAQAAPASDGPVRAAPERMGPEGRPAELARDNFGTPYASTDRWGQAPTLPPPRDPGNPGPRGPGGPGRPRSPHRRRRGWLVAALALLLIAGATAGVTAALNGGGKPTAAPSQPMTGSGLGMSSSPSASGGMAASSGACTTEKPVNGHQGPTTLAGVINDASRCSQLKNQLPSDKCKPQGGQRIVCTAPVAGISQVTFWTYSSLGALYGAYTATVESLAGTSTLQQNTVASCGTTGATYAEAGWNHQERHPHQYTVAQLAANKVLQLDAMGRLACFTTGSSHDLVWTTDVGHMLAIASGTGSASEVYRWWGDIHHVIIFPGTQMCSVSGRMESVPLGNLVQEPTCPAGAGMSS